MSQTVTVLSSEQVCNLLQAGVPQKEIPIMEDLVRYLLPYTRQMDIFEEAFARYKAIKRKAAIEAAKKQKEYLKKYEHEQAIVRHGGIHSMANDKIYTSKEAYRRDLKALGYVEVGNEDTVAIAKKKKKEREEAQQKESDKDINNILAKLF